MNRVIPPISHARLLEVLDYNPNTGVFLNKTSGKGKSGAGEKAGSPSNGYIDIQIDGARRRAHQWAWFYVTGEWPQSRIDHRDLDRSNNKWDNLRLCTQSQNLANRRAFKPGQPKGIRQKGDKWQARIRVDYQEINLGTFTTQEDAAEAYKIAAKKHWGEFYRA